MKTLTKWIIGCVCLLLIGCEKIFFQHTQTISAIWIIAVSLLAFFIGYRYYSLFIANQVLRADSSRPTPAVRHNDGLDYVPTNRFILFGHHFAAIAGAGPLVGPVLAAQMGYLPGLLWILFGVTLAGAVQDFIVLFISIRHDGRSLGELIKTEIGLLPGLAAQCTTFLILIIILAALSLIVVKTLMHSPWGFFTVAATIPIGVGMGCYLRFIRPGRVAEVSIIGFVLLMLAIIAGGKIANIPHLAAYFSFESETLIWMLMAYGFVASVLPVWLLLAPRDYLSTFLKVGALLALAAAIFFISPHLKMPAVTRFIDGSGPVWSGELFPFLFITIACGAVSGFHSLIATGTSPKMIMNEKDARLIGYGGMLLEAFVAVMALIAASCLEPGIYFAVNSPPGLIGNTVESASRVVSEWGFMLNPEMLTSTAKAIGEQTILSRTGGAPTLAIGMAQIFSQVFTNQTMLAFWYHFAILFEALFILTAIDAGTRTGRFMLQDLMGTFFPQLKKTESWQGNILATFICVAAWGYFLYQGVIDPLGGINTLWPLFGISNQMLAAIALMLCTIFLIKMHRLNYVWVTLLPMLVLVTCTLTAAWQKAFSLNAKIGFLAHAALYKSAMEAGRILAPAHQLGEMYQVIINDYIDASLVIIFSVVLIVILFISFFRLASHKGLFLFFYTKLIYKKKVLKKY